LDISSNILEDMDLGASPLILTYDIFGSMEAYEEAHYYRNMELQFRDASGLPFWVHLMNMTTPQSDWEAFSTPHSSQLRFNGLLGPLRPSQSSTQKRCQQRIPKKCGEASCAYRHGWRSAQHR
jgi:hypothetical protein